MEPIPPSDIINKEEEYKVEKSMKSQKTRMQHTTFSSLKVI